MELRTVGTQKFLYNETLSEIVAEARTEEAAQEIVLRYNGFDKLAKALTDLQNASSELAMTFNNNDDHEDGCQCYACVYDRVSDEASELLATLGR